MDREQNTSKQDQMAISRSDLPKASVMALIEKSPIASVISNPRLADNPIVAVNDAFQQLTSLSVETVGFWRARRPSPG